jgi:flavin-dependent dehydrogenase
MKKFGTKDHNSENEYNIMIIGGGPAGISTWLHLNKNAPELASKTVLIEKENYPRDKICGGALGGWTEEKLKQMSVKIDIPSVWIHSIECKLGDNIYKYSERNFFRIVRRFEFDQALAKTAISRGLKINEGEKFLDFKRTNEGIIIKTDHNIYRTCVLIGADGSLSAVRRKMKNIKKPHFAPGIEIFSPVNQKYDPEFDNNTAMIDFSPIRKKVQGYIWHFPCFKDGKPTMNHGIVNFRLDSNTSQTNLAKIFDKSLNERNIHVKQKYWSGHPISCLTDTNTISQPNILLVGDAAGIDSAIGGGIHLALSYGELASKMVIDAFYNNDFSFEGYKDQLKSHIAGKYINKLSHLANIMYNDETKTLEIIQKIFSAKS